jgi:hypothetical protein
VPIFWEQDVVPPIPYVSNYITNFTVAGLSRPVQIIYLGSNVNENVFFSWGIFVGYELDIYFAASFLHKVVWHAWAHGRPSTDQSSSAGKPEELGEAPCSAKMACQSYPVLVGQEHDGPTSYWLPHGTYGVTFTKQRFLSRRPSWFKASGRRYRGHWGELGSMDVCQRIKHDVVRSYGLDLIYLWVMTRVRAETENSSWCFGCAVPSGTSVSFIRTSSNVLLDWSDFDSAMAGRRSASGRRRQLREPEDKVSTDLYITSIFFYFIFKLINNK